MAPETSGDRDDARRELKQLQDTIGALRAELEASVEARDHAVQAACDTRDGEIRQLQTKLGITTILVTHDQAEAMSMSDRIAVMFGGEISQIATPKDIYQSPLSRQVADFLGGMNFLTAGNIATAGEQFSADIPGIGKVTGRLAPGTATSTEPVIGIRPERLRIVWEGENADPVISGKVADRHYFGEVTNLAVEIEGQEKRLSVVETNDFGADDIPIGSPVRLTYDKDAFVYMPN